MEKPVCVLDFENYACKVMPKSTLEFIQEGAGSELTLNINRTAFSEFRIRPKLMRNVANRSMSVRVLGADISMPIGIAPTSCQKIAYPEGECASAKAAEEMNSVFILSMASTRTIEEVAASAPNCTKWFQIYIYKDREVTANLVKRAEKSGFKAIVLTVDSPVLGNRLGTIRSNVKLLFHMTMPSFEERNWDEAGLNNREYSLKTLDQSIEWDDIKWLQKLTTLPIVVKGILTGEDAIKAVKMGASGIVVSNHGGRQLDSVPATIEVLPEIVKAVGDKVEIYFDGGVREGVDVFKALGLGAKMVFVGRPVIWGLCYNGQKGVVDLLKLLKDELDNVMALSGCSSLKDISKNMVVHKCYYSQL